MKLICKECNSTFYKETRLNNHNCKKITNKEKSEYTNVNIEEKIKIFMEIVDTRPFGKENKEFLDFDTMYRIILSDDPHYSYMKIMYMNIEHPENKNILVNEEDINSSYIKLHDNAVNPRDNWVKMPLIKIKEMMKEETKKELLKFFNENRDKIFNKMKDGFCDVITAILNK